MPMMSAKRELESAYVASMSEAEISDLYNRASVAVMMSKRMMNSFFIYPD
jgi:hypothetical protein